MMKLYIYLISSLLLLSKYTEADGGCRSSPLKGYMSSLKNIIKFKLSGGCFWDVTFPTENKMDIRTCFIQAARESDESGESGESSEEFDGDSKVDKIRLFIRNYMECQLELKNLTMENGTVLDTSKVMEEFNLIEGNETKIEFLRNSFGSCLNESSNSSNSSNGTEPVEIMVASTLCSMKRSLEYCVDNKLPAKKLAMAVPFFSILEDEKCSNVDVMSAIGDTIQICQEEIGLTSSFGSSGQGTSRNQGRNQGINFPGSQSNFGGFTRDRPRSNGRGSMSGNRNRFSMNSNGGGNGNGFFGNGDNMVGGRNGNNRNGMFGGRNGMFGNRGKRSPSRNGMFGGRNGGSRNGMFGNRNNRRRGQGDQKFSLSQLMELDRCVGEAEGFIGVDGYNWSNLTEFLVNIPGWEDSTQERDQLRNDIDACQTPYNPDSSFALLRQSLNFTKCFFPKFANNCGFNTPLTLFFYPHMAKKLPEYMVERILEVDDATDELDLVDDPLSNDIYDYNYEDGLDY